MVTHFGLGSLLTMLEVSRQDRSSCAEESMVMGDRGDWGWSTIMGVVRAGAGGVDGGGDDDNTSSSPRSLTTSPPSLPVSITSISAEWVTQCLQSQDEF